MRSANDRIVGTVKWYSAEKGYGFISIDGGKDMFVHVSGLRQREDLHEGERVSFVIVEGTKGPKADDVVMEPDR